MNTHLFSNRNRRARRLEVLEGRLCMAAPDAYEVDDLPDSAATIALNAPAQLRSIHSGTDVDWVRLSVTQPSRLTLQTDGASGDTQLWLYGPGNPTTQIAYDDDSGNGGFSRVTTVVAAGQYYAKIADYGQNDPIDSYSLAATVTLVPIDPFETDDTPAQSRPITTDGTFQNRSIHLPNDVDWLRLEFSEAVELVMETDGPSGDTSMRLFGSGNLATALASDDDGGNGDFSRIVAYIDAGVYFVSVAEAGQDDAVEAYRIRATTRPLRELVDAYEPDDLAIQAAHLTPNGMSQPRNLHRPGDLDWASFTLTRSERVTIETNGAAGDTRLRLFGPESSTAQVAYDDDSGEGNFSRIVADLLPGRYYVQVDEYGGDNPIASYQLRVTSTPIGDLRPVEYQASSVRAALGDRVMVTWTGGNTGVGPIEALPGGSLRWTDAVYLSLDANLGGDRRLATHLRSGAALAAGDSYAASLEVEIPIDVQWAGKSAYLLIVTDDDRQVGEMDEANNVVAPPIQIDPYYFELRNPVSGDFFTSTPTIDFQYLGVHLTDTAVFDLAVDTDSNPTNDRGHTWLATGLAETSPTVPASVRRTLPPLGQRKEPYYLWARVSDSGNTYHSKPIPIYVGHQAASTEDPLGDTVGGSGYEVFGLSALQAGNQLRFRVRTNFRPDTPSASTGGDLRLAVGDAIYGIAINSHAAGGGKSVVAGDLYRGAVFRGGTVVSSVPTFIDDYASRVGGHSTVAIHQTPHRDWNYEIEVSVDLSALPDYDQGETVEASWAMYCGNDTATVPITPQDPETDPDLSAISLGWSSDETGAQFHYEVSGDDLPGPARLALYWAQGESHDAVMGGPIHTLSSETAVGSYGPLSVTWSSLSNRPPLATHLLFIADPDDAIVELNEENNVQSLEIDVLAVNVVTHGFNPTPWDWNGFLGQWRDLQQRLQRVPQPGSVLDGRVRTHLQQWDSSSGWYGALSSLLASVVLPAPWSGIARRMVSHFMDLAARQAAAAAQSIVDTITADWLLDPALGQIIHLVGHSRGAAVSARASALLAQMGYTVDQFTSLDGYSTDWPDLGWLLADISIVDEATARRKVNYTVERSLSEVLIDSIENWIGVSITPAVVDRIVAALANWKAPPRGSYGFQDVLIPGCGGAASNHVNVTPFYTNCGDYVNDNFVGQHRYDTPVAVGPSPWNPQSPVPAPTAMASHRNLNQPFTDFVDGGFEALGQAWNEIATSAPPAIADPFIEFWVNLIRGPAGVISSTWDTTGSVEVVHAGGGFALELFQTADTSLAQQIYLGQSSHEIAFDLSVISTGTDDYLEVLVGTERVGSIRLSGLSSQVRRYGVLLPEGAARFAPVSFRLVGPATTPARVYLDNLAVRSVGVAVGQVALSATSWAEGVSPLAAIARPIMVDGGPSAPSPWANLNQVSLDFSGDAAVRQSDLTIRGPNQGLIPVTSFSYDSVRNTGTWTLGQPLVQGHHTIELSSALIDGDRNGQPGGTFRFSFDVLPGDVDGNGRVDRSDLTAVHRSMFEQLGTAGYDPELDIDGNGRLSVLDTIWVRNRIGSTIVGQSPQPDAIAVAAFPESRSPTAALRIADRTARHPRQDQRSTSASIGYADRQRLDQPRPIAARALRSAFRKLERIDTALANWPS